MTLHARNFTQDPDAAFTQLELNVKTLQDALLRLQSDWEVYAGGVTKAIDRLTAERDAARRDLNAIFELTITDVMASYDPEQIVHHVSILRKERDAALAKLESEGRE